MNKYYLQRYQYASSTNVSIEVEAYRHTVENGRINFYDKKLRLIKSYPSDLIAITKIEYPK